MGAGAAARSSAAHLGYVGHATPQGCSDAMGASPGESRRGEGGCMSLARCNQGLNKTVCGERVQRVACQQRVSGCTAAGGGSEGAQMQGAAEHTRARI
eukprot:scaffold101785_cov30-Tisochrysis_lutea.AAC.1